MGVEFATKTVQVSDEDEEAKLQIWDTVHARYLRSRARRPLDQLCAHFIKVLQEFFWRFL